MAGVTWPALTAGKKARGSDVEEKFDWIEGDVVPMNAGVKTDNSYNLGEAANRWKNLYISTNIYIAATGKLYLDGGGDTYITETSANLIDIWAGNSKWFFVGWAAGGAGIYAGYRLYLDGGGDTYITESSANTVQIYVGGVLISQYTTTQFYIGAALDVVIAATKKLYLDGGGDTYITELSANRVIYYVGGAPTLDINATSVLISSGQDLSIASTKKLYLDGGGDTYIVESSANAFALFTGGTVAMGGNNTVWYIPAVYSNTSVSAANVYVDSGGNLYRSTSAAKYKDIISELDFGVDSFMKLNPVVYSRKEDENKKHFYGLIADKVADIYPDLGVYGKDNEIEDYDQRGILAIALKMIQKQQKEIETLRKKLN